MINDIINDLKDMETRYKSSVLLSEKKDVIIPYLIYLKYLCDKGVYNYDEVIDNLEIYKIIHGIRLMCYRLEKEKIPVNSILRKYKNIDIKDLVLDYLNSSEKQIEFHNDKDKIVYIGLDINIYGLYNDKGNATYVIDENHKDFDFFKALDEVLGINNNYISKNNLDISNYDYIYVYDNVPKYLSIRNNNNLYDDIYDYIHNDKKVVLYSKYSKVSNFSSGRRLVRHIKNIIMDNDKVVILFNNEINKEISIINYDNIKDLNKLHSIIKNNRKQKDVLVKTNYDELRENNLRIGFNLYQLEKDNEIRDINKIVDENTRYLEELNRINEKVEDEINRLLNR